MSVVISLLEAKDFLKVDYSDQDTTIQALIDGAENWVELTCGIAFTSATRTEDLDGGGYGLRPTFKPIASITSVTDTETAVAEPSDDYDLKDEAIYREDMTRWADEPHNRWRVVYVGGATAPAGIVTVVLQLVARAYESRGGKQTQGAAGYGVTWQLFAQSDIMKMLQPFIKGGSFVG